MTRLVSGEFGPFILFVGTIEPRKNLGCSSAPTSAIANRPAGGPPRSSSPVRPAGGPRKTSRSSACAARANWSGSAGASDDQLLLLYNAASLLVLPSHYEGFRPDRDRGDGLRHPGPRLQFLQPARGRRQRRGPACRPTTPPPGPSALREITEHRAKREAMIAAGLKQADNLLLGPRRRADAGGLSPRDGAGRARRAGRHGGIVPALIVGLGNPGKEYADTRHNVGFRTVEELARRARLNWEKPRLKAEQARGTIAGRDVVLAKPQTYMNLSGVSVVQLVKWYKVPLDQLLIVHDDLDLPFGHLRLRAEGSAGGQNGMDSIIEQLRTKADPAPGIGIGRPQWGDREATSSTRFTKEQAPSSPTCSAAPPTPSNSGWREGIIAAMNKYNGAVLSDRARS